MNNESWCPFTGPLLWYSRVVIKTSWELCVQGPNSMKMIKPMLEVNWLKVAAVSDDGWRWAFDLNGERRKIEVWWFIVVVGEGKSWFKQF